MTSFRQFQAELEALHQQSQRARRVEKSEALATILGLIAEYQLTLEELGLDVDPPIKPSSLEPRYRDPLTGATWSGRGRSPKWLDGKDRAAYRVG